MNKTKNTIILIISICFTFIILTQRSALSEYSRKGIPDIKVGDIVYFGNYFQTSPKSDMTPIEWVVLERNNNKALLITTYSIDFMPFHNDPKGSQWPNSSIRKWLNSDFYNTAFSSAEKKAIINTSHESLVYYTAKKNKTSDKVFLLDINEAKRYFGSYDIVYNHVSDYEYVSTTAEFRRARPSHYAGNPYGPPAKGEWDYSTWLLRSNWSDNENVAVMNKDAEYYYPYSIPSDQAAYVRPAITLDLTKIETDFLKTSP